ncbi:MAG: hypothetical protein ABIN69_05105 [Aestuariivirga sp.]
MLSPLSPGHCIETALPTAYLESKLVGAVIGLYQSSFNDALMRPA